MLRMGHSASPDLMRNMPSETRSTRTGSGSDSESGSFGFSSLPPFSVTSSSVAVSSSTWTSRSISADGDHDSFTSRAVTSVSLVRYLSASASIADSSEPRGLVISISPLERLTI